MKLYIVRHGQTDYNAQGKYIGTHDIPLNKTGCNEAVKARKIVRNINFDRIYCSPKRRCIETARLICPTTNLIIDHSIRERNVGVFEGLTKDEAQKKFPELYARVITRIWDEAPPGEETITDVEGRIFNFLGRLQANLKNETCLIVTHGFISKMINYYFHSNISEEQFFEFSLKNCEVRTYKLLSTAAQNHLSPT
ncbi:MAG: histidine phosphatase family protein [Patescibacteria group bacterium]|nr:histidine phosphatase family protein [Patescibacteria group bacterium]